MTINEFVTESAPYATGSIVSAALQALQMISDIPACPGSVVGVISHALQAIRSLDDLRMKKGYWSLLTRITDVSSSIIGRWMGKGEFGVHDDARESFQRLSDHHDEHKALDWADDLGWADEAFAMDEEEIGELKSSIRSQLEAGIQSMTDPRSRNEQVSLPRNVSFLRQRWFQSLHSSVFITYRMLQNISQLDDPDEGSESDPRPFWTIDDFVDPSKWLDIELSPTWFRKQKIELEGRADAKVKGSLTGRTITFVKEYQKSKISWVYGGIITPWGLVGQWGKSLDQPPMGEFMLWIVGEEGAEDVVQDDDDEEEEESEEDGDEDS